MMSLWDALRMNMMISYQELVRTFLKTLKKTPPQDYNLELSKLLEYVVLYTFLVQR